MSPPLSAYLDLYLWLLECSVFYCLERRFNGYIYTIMKRRAVCNIVCALASSNIQVAKLLTSYEPSFGSDRYCAGSVIPFCTQERIARLHISVRPAFHIILKLQKRPALKTVLRMTVNDCRLIPMYKRMYATLMAPIPTAYVLRSFKGSLAILPRIMADATTGNDSKLL